MRGSNDIFGSSPIPEDSFGVPVNEKSKSQNSTQTRME